MARGELVNRTWTVGEYVFQEVETDWAGERRTFYRFGVDGLPRSNELFDSVEHAIVSAIAEKYTGRRGAGGTAVGTAADWFMRMVGADAFDGMTAAQIAAQQDAEARKAEADRISARAARHHVPNAVMDSIDWRDQ